MAWPEDLTSLLKRISTPAEEVFKGLRVLGDYLNGKITAVTTNVDTKLATLGTKEGTEFAIHISFAEGAETDLRIILTTGLALTGAADGDVILKSASLMTGTVVAGSNAGMCLTSDDADYPLDVSLVKEHGTLEALGSVVLYHADIDYRVKSGKLINAASATAIVTSGPGVFELIFVRAADGASIAAA